MFQFHQKPPPAEAIAPRRHAARRPQAFLLLTALLVLAYWLRYVLLPFVVAAALAYLAMPAIRAAQTRLGWPRRLGALAAFVLYLGVLALIGYGIARLAVPQLAAVMSDLPALLHRFFLTLFGGETARVLGTSLNATQLSTELSSWRPVENSFNAGQWMSVGGTAVAAAMGLILTLVLLLYFLFEGPRLARGAVGLVPPAHRPRVLRIAGRAGPVLYRYIAGVLVVVFYTIALTWCFAGLWLGLPHAELLAIAVGLLEMIPVAGPVLSVMMIALIAIEQMTFGMILSVAVFATALRLSIDQFVGPIVLGKATRLPPPVIIFAFLAGGAIYGALGVLVAIPVLAVGKIALQELYGEPNSTV